MTTQCPNCNAILSGTENYCGSCGTHLQNAVAATVNNTGNPPSLNTNTPPLATPVSPTYYPPALHELTYLRGQCEQAASAHLREANFYRQSLIRCSIAGGIITSLFSPLFFSSGAGAVLLSAVTLFLIPFGMAPVLKYVNSHGWFIIFNWIFLIVVGSIVFFAAIILGPIYLIYAASKISSHNKQANNLFAQANYYAEQIARMQNPIHINRERKNDAHVPSSY